MQLYITTAIAIPVRLPLFLLPPTPTTLPSAVMNNTQALISGATAQAFNSPKKSARATDTDDASTHLPSLRSDRERPSPGANRKISGSGAPRATRDPFGSPFLGGPLVPGREFTLGDPFKTPPNSRRRETHLRRHSASPTPSRRISDALETGHHATDVDSDLEDGEIPDGE